MLVVSLCCEHERNDEGSEEQVTGRENFQKVKKVTGRAISFMDLA